MDRILSPGAGAFAHHAEPMISHDPPPQDDELPRDARRIDPDGRYPSEGLRAFERLALSALEWRTPHRLARTRDAIEITFPDAADEDRELTVLLTPEAVELRLPCIEWTMGSYGPVRSSQLWKRVAAEEVSEGGLHGLLDKLRAALGRRLRRCRYCGRRFLASRMTGRACHGCASRFEGVVY